MNGMKLSKKYFDEVLFKKLKEEFKNVPIAAGLIGYGSECYGYDDNISRDHDFSAMPAIWLSHENYLKYGEDMIKFLDTLPKEFEGYKVLDKSAWGEGRRGILDLDEFVFTFLGTEKGPTCDNDYRKIPQYLLAAFTNGEIFIDEFGEITELRKKFKFYPRDIKFNMMATRCMNMNSAFVNYERCIKRKELVAANQALSLYITASIEMYFLLHNRYCPYYKWYHKMLGEIDKKGYDLMNELVDPSKSYTEKINIMDSISNDIMEKLEDDDIIIRVADFIGYYGPVIQSRINDESIRELGCWRD